MPSFLVLLLGLVLSSLLLVLAQTPPSITLFDFDTCLFVQGVGSQVIYQFDGATPKSWVGIYRKGAPVESHLTWAWTCPKGPIDCTSRVSGKGQFFLPPESEKDIFFFRMFGDVDYRTILAQSAEFQIPTSCNLPVNPTGTKVLNVQEECRNSTGCVSTLATALEKGKNMSGVELIINMAAGKYCADNLEINITSFEYVTFQGVSVNGPTNTSTYPSTVIKYCSPPIYSPSPCSDKTKCLLDSFHFKIMMSGVTFNGLLFEGNVTGTDGHLSKTDSSVTVGLRSAITNWKLGYDNGNWAPTNITPVTNLAILFCGFIFYENAAIAFIDANLDVNDTYISDMGTISEFSKRQGTSSSPVFSNTGTGGSAVSTVTSTGRVSRNTISRSEVGIQISDEDPFGPTKRTHLRGAPELPEAMSIEDSYFTNFTYGIAAGFLEKPISLSLARNSVRKGNLGMYVGRIGISVNLAIEDNDFAEVNTGKLLYDVQSEISSLSRNRFQDVETGIRVSACSDLYGPAGDSKLELTSPVVNGSNSTTAFVFDNDPKSHPDCATRRQSGKTEVNIVAGRATARLAVYHYGDIEIDDSASIILKGDTQLYENGGDGDAPNWPSCEEIDCNKRGYCAGLSICTCYKDPETGLAIAAGYFCESPVEKQYLNVTTSGIECQFGIIHFQFKWNTTLEDSWVALYSVDDPLNPVTWFWSDFPNGTVDISLPLSNYPSPVGVLYAVMYGDDTMENIVAITSNFDTSAVCVGFEVEVFLINYGTREQITQMTQITIDQSYYVWVSEFYRVLEFYEEKFYLFEINSTYFDYMDTRQNISLSNETETIDLFLLPTTNETTSWVNWLDQPFPSIANCFDPSSCQLVEGDGNIKKPETFGAPVDTCQAWGGFAGSSLGCFPDFTEGCCAFIRLSKPNDTITFDLAKEIQNLEGPDIEVYELVDPENDLGVLPDLWAISLKVRWPETDVNEGWWTGFWFQGVEAAVDRDGNLLGSSSSFNEEAQAWLTSIDLYKLGFWEEPIIVQAVKIMALDPKMMIVGHDDYSGWVDLDRVCETNFIDVPPESICHRPYFFNLTASSIGNWNEILGMYSERQFEPELFWLDSPQILFPNPNIIERKRNV